MGMDLAGFPVAGLAGFFGAAFERPGAGFGTGAAAKDGCDEAGAGGTVAGGFRFGFGDAAVFRAATLKPARIL